jgi:hypothetical protein
MTNLACLPDWVQDHMTQQPLEHVEPLSAQLVGIRNSKPAWLVELELQKEEALRALALAEERSKRELDRKKQLRDEHLCAGVTTLLADVFGFKEHEVNAIDGDLYVSAFGHIVRMRWINEYTDSEELATMDSIPFTVEISDGIVIGRVESFIRSVKSERPSFCDTKTDSFLILDNDVHARYGVIEFYNWVTGGIQ